MCARAPVRVECVRAGVFVADFLGKLLRPIGTGVVYCCSVGVGFFLMLFCQVGCLLISSEALVAFMHLRIDRRDRIYNVFLNENIPNRQIRTYLFDNTW